jgi:glycine dehydrogenase
LGYHQQLFPAIQRNIFENRVGTPLTPVPSRNCTGKIRTIQTMVIELTGMEIANASLLDESTAAAEQWLYV